MSDHVHKLKTLGPDAILQMVGSEGDHGDWDLLQFAESSCLCDLVQMLACLVCQSTDSNSKKTQWSFFSET